MPRFRQLAAIAAAAGALALFASMEQAAAQSGARNSLSQSRSGSLRSNYTGGISGARDGISSSYGASTGGAFAQQGRGGVGGGAGNGGAMGQSGLGSGPMSAGLSQAGSERFQQGGFVGRDAQDVRTGFQSQSGGRGGMGGMLDNMIENLNEMRDSRRRWREQNAAPPAIRVQLQPAFDAPAPLPLLENIPMQRRLSKEMAAVGISSPSMEMNGRTAVIRGVVATQRDRELIARLALLEPGVSEVENLVEIQPPTPPTP